MRSQKLATSSLRRKYKLLVATAISALLSIGIIALCFIVAPNRQSGAMALLIGIVGMLIGWMIAVALTPYSKEEKYQFSVYSKAIGVFASGYLVAKIDKVFEYLLDPNNIFASGSENGFRMLIFIASGFLSLVTVFTHRQYIAQDEFERKRRENVVEVRTELTTQSVEVKPNEL